ncbi:glycosyltransferase family 4 protein, partial [Chloroflexota bacterium]
GAHGIANAMDTIMEAMRLLQQNGDSRAYLLMVGNGPEKPKLMAEAEEWQLDNVNFFESVPKNAVPKVLKAIDIAILSTRKSELYKYGTSVNKLFDYMAAARPVILGADVADNPVILAECGITLRPENSEEMAGAIKELCDMSAQQRAAMGARGCEYVTRYHSVPNLVDKLLRVIEDSDTGGKDP